MGSFPAWSFLGLLDVVGRRVLSCQLHGSIHAVLLSPEGAIRREGSTFHLLANRDLLNVIYLSVHAVTTVLVKESRLLVDFVVILLGSRGRENERLCGLCQCMLWLLDKDGLRVLLDEFLLHLAILDRIIAARLCLLLGQIKLLLEVFVQVFSVLTFWQISSFKI